MATIPVYRTWVAGEIVTAAEMNANIRDAGNFWEAKPYFNGYNNAGVACTSGVLTLMPWDTETEDNDGMHSTGTNPSRVICQTPGVFEVNTRSSWTANVALINRRLSVRLNAAGASGGGSTVVITDSASAATGSLSTGNLGLTPLTYFYRFANIGDYLETFVEQTSGGSLTTVTGTASYFQIMFHIP